MLEWVQSEASSVTRHLRQFAFNWPLLRQHWCGGVRARPKSSHSLGKSQKVWRSKIDTGWGLASSGWPFSAPLFPRDDSLWPRSSFARIFYSYFRSRHKRIISFHSASTSQVMMLGEMLRQFFLSIIFYFDRLLSPSLAFSKSRLTTSNTVIQSGSAPQTLLLCELVFADPQ